MQHSPKNPPAAWLWRELADIEGQALQVRVGGDFVWPPPGVEVNAETDPVVFVAGGVGVKYAISIPFLLLCKYWVGWLDKET